MDLDVVQKDVMTAKMKMSTVAQVVQSEGMFSPSSVGISIHRTDNTGKAYKKGEEITFNLTKKGIS